MKRLILALILVFAMVCPAYAGNMNWLRVKDKLYVHGKTYFYDEIQLNSGQAIDEFSTDSYMTDESNTALPTERAVKHYSDRGDATIKGYEYIVYDADAYPDLENSWMINWNDAGFNVTTSVSGFAINELNVGLDDATDAAKGIASFGDTGNITVSSGDVSLNLAAGDTYTYFGDADDDTLDELFAAIDTAWVLPAGDDGHVQYNNSGAFGGEASLFWDDTDKRLGIGTNSPSAKITAVEEGAGCVLVNLAYSNTATHAGQFNAGHARGTEASPSATQSGDVMGKYTAYGMTETTFYTGARMEMVATENWTDEGPGVDKGSRIDWYTVDNDTPTADLRLTLDQDGKLFFPIGTGINEFSIDDTLAGDSDDAVPTEQAVKAYVDTEIAGVSASPGGADTQIQYNNGGSFGGDSELVWDDGSKYLGLGIAGPLFRFHIYGTNGTATAMAFTRVETDIAGPNFIFQSADAGPGLRDQNDYLGSIQWNAYDGGEYLNAGYINMVLSEATGDDDMPGSMVFVVTGDGQASGTERMRLSHDGYLGVYLPTNPEFGIHLKGDAGNSAWIAAERYSDDVAPAYLIGRKSRAGAVVADDDFVTLFGAYGYDGDTFEQLAAISMEVDGAPGDGDVPGRIVFYTTPDGAYEWIKRMVINEDGFVGIGSTVTDPIGALHVRGTFEAGSCMYFERASDNSSPPNFYFYKSRGTGAGGAVELNDYLMSFRGLGWDGDSWAYGVGLFGRVDGTPSDGDMPTSLEFYTTPDGSETWARRMTIDNLGNVGIGNDDPTYMLDIEGESNLTVARITRVQDDTGGPMLFFQSADAGPGLRDENDVLAYILFQGYDGDEYAYGAQIYAKVTGATGDDDMPTSLYFYTTPDASKTPALALTLSDDQRVGIGTTDPIYLLDIVADENYATLATRAYSDASHYGSFYGFRARGTVAIPAAVQADDIVANFGGLGYDGDTFEAGTIIRFLANETFTDADRGSYMDFYTTDNDSTTLDLRMKIDHDGIVYVYQDLDLSDTDIDNVAWIGLDGVRADTDNDVFYIGDGADQPLILLDGTPAADDKVSGWAISSVNAGEAIAQWDLVYMDDTANEWMLADANAAGKFPARGMALAACTDGNACTVLIRGVVRNAGWAATLTGDGKILYLSETAGGITETAPTDSTDCVQHVGWVLQDANNTIVFDPNTLWIVLD
jgi:hypothetical protein